jgi:methionyl-tRNA formyltransferase
VPTLDALSASDHDIALVVTSEPRPGRRGREANPTPVAARASQAGIPFVETASVKSGAGLLALSEARPDVLVVVAFGELLSREVLDLAPYGALNVHFSLLPKLRGASPVQTAILEGAASTGATVMLLDEGMDTGPVLLRETETIGGDDDAGSLGDRLAASGAVLLVKTLDRLEQGTIIPDPQVEADATFAPKLTPADRRLDWRQGAESLERRVRAFAPAPGASTSLGDSTLKILAVRLHASGSESAGRVAAEPGEVLSVSPEGSVVATGDGALALVVVAPEGRKHMSGPEFVRGGWIRPGDKLG